MIEVLDPGFLTTVQDARGRPGWRHVSVPVGGAADPWSARLANRLVGNRDEAPVLEVTLTGPTLAFDAATAVAMTGARFDAALDGRLLPPFEARAIRAGSTLHIGSGDGARCYLSVGGEIAAEVLLGSASTDLRAGFGGHDGRALRAGDRLAIGIWTGIARRWTGTLSDGPIRIISGPQAERLRLAELTDPAWTVSNAADRTAVRLDGAALKLPEPEVPSMALPIGAIQIPPDGHPIMMLADRPATGGYPVVACIIQADINLVARLRPGDSVAFELVSVPEARAAYRQAQAELAALEFAEPAALDWAGALE